MITVPPSDMDATVGESIVLPCQVSHDPSVDVVFTWAFNGNRIDFTRGIHHFERIGRVSFLTHLGLKEPIRLVLDEPSICHHSFSPVSI